MVQLWVRDRKSKTADTQGGKFPRRQLMELALSSMAYVHTYIEMGCFRWGTNVKNCYEGHNSGRRRLHSSHWTDIARKPPHCSNLEARASQWCNFKIQISHLVFKKLSFGSHKIYSKNRRTQKYLQKKRTEYFIGIRSMNQNIAKHLSYMASL